MSLIKFRIKTAIDMPIFPEKKETGFGKKIIKNSALYVNFLFTIKKGCQNSLQNKNEFALCKSHH